MDEKLWPTRKWWDRCLPAVASIIARSTKLRKFQFLHRDCQQLTKIRIKKTPSDFFQRRTGKTSTPFLELPIMKLSWENVKARLRAFQIVQYDFSNKVNFCLLTARYYISLCKTNELTLTI